ncbi:MAG: zinc-dependent metalloprotease [Acidobacteriota bacterium]
MASAEPVRAGVAAISTTELEVATGPMGQRGAAVGQMGQQRQQGPPPSIEEKTAVMEKMDGYFPLYWDEAAGKLWLEISRFDTEVLYISGLSSGLGSNDIGLDRGQLGGSRIVTFQRVGPKVLMVQPNYRYRADSDNPDERRAVDEAFAKSILWGFTVGAETDGRVLVDTTDFLLRDAHNVSARLRPANYRIDRSRSAVYLPLTKSFPENTEMEVTLTYVGDGGGGRGFGGFGGPAGRRGPGGGFGRGSLNAVTPTPQAVTLRQHHSLVQLPDHNYTPRVYDPRSGYGAMSYQDYAVPLGVSLTKRLVRRHRLQKKDPTAAVSEPVEPIIYYVDRGTPEPIRSALIEGAGWWNQAFEAAGYRNAFQVKVMPEGASNLDVRYNVIQWVHRSTRGWSYGGSVTDPRTGEIIKGHVTLGSLRVRQDYLIAEGLLSPYENGTEPAPEVAEWALARIRQLAAHETGHTLGLGHNYYDSSQGRISVMDYPHPLVTLNDDGSLDTSQVYDVGIGAWDKVTIAYGYQDFPDGTDEQEALGVILNEAWSRDLRYMTNQDLSADPKVDQWSNGTDPAAELERMMKVRRAALGRFGERAIKLGMPMATIEEALVPLYLHHRYQIDAAGSALGGMHYIYALRGDGREPVRAVPASEQWAALDALLATLDPSELVLPRSVLKSIPPRPSGFGRHRELFPRYTGLMFDAVAPSTVVADLTVSNILQAGRAARMVEQHALDASLPGLGEVIDRLVTATFFANTANGYEAEVKRAVERVVADRLMRLAGRAGMPQVRAIATYRLEQIRERLTAGAEGVDGANAAHYKLLARDIERFLERPAEAFPQPATPTAPPGAPIGEPALDWLQRLEPACSQGEW